MSRYRLRMITIRSFETPEALITQTLELLKSTLASPGNLMLSGGSTPYAIYNRLAKAPCPVHSDRILFLSDERMEPVDSDKNNAHNLEPMLKALHCESQFIRVDTSLPGEQAALRFEADLTSLKTIDLGLLGMGNDGHTAGFFTNDQARMTDGPLTLYTDRPDGLVGVSITPAFLKRTDRLILLVTGESKRDVIHTLQTAPETIAAGIALAKHPNIELWTDLAL